MASTEAKGFPIDVRIEILEMGIDKECAKPEGQKLIEAVAGVFQKASLVGCEKIPGSMKDRMVIKATTVFAAANSTQITPGPYLVHFDVHKTEDPQMAYVVARFNAEKYAALQSQIRRVNMMANVKIEDARISVALSNDERESFKVFPNVGVFSDGEPIDTQFESKLEPRQEVVLKLGDVKMAYLVKYGWAGVANVRKDVPVQ